MAWELVYLFRKGGAQMIEFFSFSESARIFITTLLGVSLLFQTLAMIFNYYIKRLNLGKVFKDLLELAILLNILVYSILHGQVINGYKYGFVIFREYEKTRVISFLLILILVIIISRWDKTLKPLSIIPAAMIPLPIIEKILGPIFPWFFIAALLFYLGRSIQICRRSIKSIKTTISALSITHAIDTLHTGVLLSEEDGDILLCNQQMQNLMQAMTGRMYRNAIQFYDQLVQDHSELRGERNELDQQMVYLLTDGTVWMLTKADVFSAGKKYVHLSLADVTDLWELTIQLKEQNKKLRQKSAELKNTMENLHSLSQKKEIEQAKMRAHDILGQRLSVLLRIIQTEKKLDFDLLTALSKGLLAELKEEQKERSPYAELDNIQEIFKAIGVDVTFEGQLPDNLSQARLFAEVIREGSTNAVRHGFATKIDIQVKPENNNWKLTITNNGDSSAKPFVPGSGIRLMKKKVAEYGGSLDIIQKPLFTLSVVIPGGETDV